MIVQRRLCGREQEFGMQILPPFRPAVNLSEKQNEEAFISWRSKIVVDILNQVRVNSGLPYFSREIARAWLGNGSSFYIDQLCVLESATAEFWAGSLDGLAQEKAAEQILSRAVEEVAVNRNWQALALYKNNVGPRRGSGLGDEAAYGSHQNYLYATEDCASIIQILRNFIPAALIFSGSGHIYRGAGGRANFVLSQRAPFITGEFSLHGAGTRSLMSCKHDGNFFNCNDPSSVGHFSDFERLHIASRDGTRCEFQTWLVDAMTHLVMRLAEETDWGISAECQLVDPVVEMQQISASLEQDLDYQLFLPAKKIDLFDYNYLFLNAVKQLSPLSDEEKKALQEWERVLELLKAGAFEELVGELDWVTKRFFLQKAMARKGWNLDSVSAWKIDAEYHNISPSPEKSLFAWLDQHGKIKHLITQEEIAKARFIAPETRARHRSRFIRACWENRELRDRIRKFDWTGVEVVGYPNHIYFGEEKNPASPVSPTLEEFFKNFVLE